MRVKGKSGADLELVLEGLVEVLGAVQLLVVAHQLVLQICYLIETCNSQLITQCSYNKTISDFNLRFKFSKQEERNEDELQSKKELFASKVSSIHEGLTKFRNKTAINFNI